MKFVGQGIKKLEPEQDRQTRRQTHTNKSLFRLFRHYNKCCQSNATVAVADNAERLQHSTVTATEDKFYAGTQ